MNLRAKAIVAAALFSASVFCAGQCAPPPKTPTLKSGMVIVQQSRFLGRVVYYGMGDDVKMSSSFFTFIVRGRKHKGYMLSSSTRKYVEISDDGFQQQVNMFTHDDRLKGTLGMQNEKKAKFSEWKLVKHDSIHGLKAKCWVREWMNHPKGMGYKEEVYVAETIDIPKTLLQLLEKVDPHERMPFKGFVLRHDLVYTGPKNAREVEIDTTDWRPLKVEASTFEVPSGFTKVNDFTTLMIDDTMGGGTDPFAANILQHIPKDAAAKLKAR